MNLRILSRGACAALLFTAVPAAAAAVTPGAVPVVAAQALSLPAADAVAAYYDRTGNTPIWLRGGITPVTGQLVEILRRAPVDGLAIGPQLAADVEAALMRARSGNPADSRAAERLLSTAWLLYVEALQAPPAGMTYADVRLAPRRFSPDQILRQAADAASGALLPQHVRSVSAVNPIYAELRRAALNQTPLGAGLAGDSRIQANLERARAFPSKGRFIIVDAASQRLLMVEDGAVRDSMKVVVGKPASQTPMLASTIHWATLNPYWNVPTDLSQKLIAPKVLDQGLTYLTSRGYEVVTSFDGSAQMRAAKSVDWKAVAEGRETVYVRQLPGGANAMGQVKFSFANTGGIYLHDTPDKSLFAQDQRSLSNGCVRLEDAARLGRWLAGSDLIATSDKPEQLVQLPRGVPVFLTYLTAQPEGGRLTFLDDIYNRDANPPTRVAALAR